VAFDPETNQFLCNADLYDKQYVNKPIKLIALMTKELKQEYETVFNEYRN
jgi:hypothetical protein